MNPRFKPEVPKKPSPPKKLIRHYPRQTPSPDLIPIFENHSDRLREMNNELDRFSEACYKHQRNTALEILEKVIQKSWDVKQFVNARSKFNSSRYSSHSATALYWACYSVKKGHLKTIWMLMAYGANPEIPCSITSETPIFPAIRAGSTPILRILLQAGADPNFQSPIGSPLHFAISQKKKELVKFLLEYGGDPKKVCLHTKSSPLDLALSQKYGEVLKALQDRVKNEENTWLILCAYQFDAHSYIYREGFPLDMLKKILYEGGLLYGRNPALQIHSGKASDIIKPKKSKKKKP